MASTTILGLFPLKAPTGGRPCSSAAPSRRRVSNPSSIRCAMEKQPPRDGAVDRRDLLLGLGGLYGATLSLNREALASPVTTPEIAQCHDVTIPNADKALHTDQCCPPASGVKVVDYQIPTFTAIRERCAAHDLTPAQIRDYETAVANSKKLDKLDPWSFEQQAKIHCAYCNGGYDVVGFPDLELQVHDSWLFLSFHRWYLYFYERILGKLCGNENFSLPYWNWDNPPGMTMPQIFINPSSPLYNVNRDQSHLPPVIVDLDNADNENFTPEEQIEHNLWIMYRTMIAGARGPSCFFGGKYVSGTKPHPGAGTLEITHNLVHRWTGNPGNPNGEDMGTFYSAGYDPIFYSHHSNIDRMWPIWKTLGGKRRDIADPDYLNASFLFYDENAQLVRVYVRDSLETERLGYRYQKQDLLWLNRRPKPRKLRTKTAKRKPAAEATFPLLLKSPVQTTVTVPKKTSPDDEDVIVIRLSLDRTIYAKFDVYVNAEDTESLGVAPPEKAGSFVNIPQTTAPGLPTQPFTYLKLGVDELLKDIGADADEEVLVSIVPRKGRNKVTIESVKLQTTCDVTET